MTPSGDLRGWKSLQRAQTLRLARLRAEAERAAGALEEARRECARREESLVSTEQGIEALHRWRRSNAAEAVRLSELCEDRLRMLTLRLADARAACAAARKHFAAVEAAYAQATQCLRKAELRSERTRAQIAEALRAATARADDRAGEEAAGLAARTGTWR